MCQKPVVCQVRVPIKKMVMWLSDPSSIFGSTSIIFPTSCAQRFHRLCVMLWWELKSCQEFRQSMDCTRPRARKWELDVSNSMLYPAIDIGHRVMVCVSIMIGMLLEKLYHRD